jgi:hypothetical protein
LAGPARWALEYRVHNTVCAICMCQFAQLGDLPQIKFRLIGVS